MKFYPGKLELFNLFELKNSNQKNEKKTSTMISIVTKLFHPFQGGRGCNRGPHVMREEQRIRVVQQWLTGTQEIRRARCQHRQICHVRVQRRLQHWCLRPHKTWVNLIFNNVVATTVLLSDHRGGLIVLISNYNNLLLVPLFPNIALELLLRLVLWWQVAWPAIFLRAREPGELLHQCHEVPRMSVDDTWRMCIDYHRVALL